MEPVKVLLDNSAANRIAELDEAIATVSGKSHTSDQTYEEDRIYVNKIISFLGGRSSLLSSLGFA